MSVYRTGRPYNLYQSVAIKYGTRIANVWLEVLKQNEVAARILLSLLEQGKLLALNELITFYGLRLQSRANPQTIAAINKTMLMLIAGRATAISPCPSDKTFNRIYQALLDGEDLVLHRLEEYCKD